MYCSPHSTDRCLSHFYSSIAVSSIFTSIYEANQSTSIASLAVMRLQATSVSRFPQSRKTDEIITKHQINLRRSKDH